MTDEIVKILLRDKTTGKNIIWATADRSTQEILPVDVENIVPRHEKSRFEQKFRTKSRAEIFTPPEVCEIQNNLVIGDIRDFEKFIDAKFLEITCGEAPYITSRYNSVTGEPIEIANRVGILDKKLKIIGNETKTVADWINFTLRAVKSVYGYEFQGDNLFLARKNIFLTVEEFFSGKIAAVELKNLLSQVADVISWNFWQMDGLTCSPPLKNFAPQLSLFEKASHDKIFCEIMNWQTNEPIIFKKLFGVVQK